MINIVVICNPNYDSKKLIGATNKNGLDIVSQFMALYKSIKKNWTNFDYRISLLKNKECDFSQRDKDKLSECDIDIYDVDSDHPDIKHYCDGACFRTELKYKGTHRLSLDCDMIALDNPNFNLDVDWQAMFGGSRICDEYSNYINKYCEYGLSFDKYKNCEGNLFKNYYDDTYHYKEIFPHFNAGAYLIREDLCKKFSELLSKGVPLSTTNKWGDIDISDHQKHMSIQYVKSFALLKLSENWEPFEKGFNFLPDIYDINKFGKNNIKLIHYCGTRAVKKIKRWYPEYFI